MVTVAEAEANPEENLGRDFFINVEDDIQFNAQDDFARINLTENLKQAIINRLRTALGELELNPNYGSKLFELIGNPGNEEVLILATAHTRNCLFQEPRIKEILSISPSYQDAARQILSLDISVQPINEITPLNLIFNLFIGA